ncbi:MAG: 3-dehydroquinate synthase [Kiritimatiellae bacterium]|nr:3-dehydroquinate synthase [Kiritimatiellia bacterium]
MTHIYLYGPPGSGKSTVGKLLAERLTLPFIDIDSVIESQAGKKIAHIFEQDGEGRFRELESAALRTVAIEPTAVIALGGGALLRPENRHCAEQSGVVLCFTADFETLQARVRRAPGQRPLVKDEGASEQVESPLKKLLEARKAHYLSFSMQLPISEIPVERTADNAQMVLGRYRVSGMGNPYNVYVGDGLMDKTGELFVEAGLGHKCVIVGDSNTAPLYSQRVAKALQESGVDCKLVTIPAGESHKTIATVGLLWKAFMDAGIERGDTVVALGGGVTGDLTGFAAATWLRGVRWVSMPTSLLAMCDSGLGGKTGADLPEGKNLIGAFHPPALVIADTASLATLPVREIRCGLAESIKHAIIADPELLLSLPQFAFCKTEADANTCAHLQGAPWLAQFVARSMAVKIRVICEDPFEKGVRAALNLGHTVGHGIEVATDFELLHGEAIAIGTVIEGEIAVALGLAKTTLPQTLAALFQSVGLPVKIPAGIDCNAILQAITHDKKRAGGIVRFALPIAIGKVQTNVEVKDQVLRDKITC